MESDDMDRRDGVQTQVVHQQNRIVGQPPTRYQGWLHVLGGLMLLLAVFVMLGV